MDQNLTEHFGDIRSIYITLLTPLTPLTGRQILLQL